MKKIPTLFERTFKDYRVVGITDKVTPGMEWVLAGEGTATIKYDGSCCAIIDGELYKRFDAKKGRKIPEGAIPCCDPDPITGHHPHWVMCVPNNPADKWFFVAQDRAMEDYGDGIEDGTYEAVGIHFNGNPYGMDHDILLSHGEHTVIVLRSFEGIREYLRNNYVEGLVFWKDGEPQCKIKRTDFGFEWPIKNKEE